VSGLSIEPAAETDLDSIVALERESLGWDAWTEPLIREGLEGRLPTIRYLAARVADELAGYAVVSLVADVAELQRIAVAPAYRRTGVASALIEALVDLAADTEADRVLLEVREDNEAALGCYAQSGFVEIDRRPRYYRDGAAAVVMLKPLSGSGTSATSA
jgi:ribosomal-protein-alanine acetyltransferase